MDRDINDFAPNFNCYFQEGDEQGSQPHISIDPHLIHVHGMLPSSLPPIFLNQPHELQHQHPNNPSPTILNSTPVDHTTTSISSRKKRMMTHREIERHRRQEMSTLYMSLRAHLPLEYLKGKRSISDHMDEAVNYIKDLEQKIQDLTSKRDRLKRASSSESSSSSTYVPHITVHSTLSGVAVAIYGEKGIQIPLSKVIAAMTALGLNVIGMSTYTNSQWVYSIECQIDELVNPVELQQKLTDIFKSSSWAEDES